MSLTRFPRSIRAKLTLLVAIAVLPAFGILLYHGFEDRRHDVEIAQRRALSFVRRAADIQERTTDATRQLLASLAMLPDVKAFNAPACNTLFAAVIAANPIYANLHLLDLEGNLLASGLPSAPTNFADRKQFREAIATRGFAAGEYVVSRTNAVPIFPFGQAVFDAQGQLRGALIIGLKLEETHKFLSTTSLPEESFLGVVDHNGIRLFRLPNQETAPIGSPITPNVFAAISGARSEGISIQRGLGDVERIYAFQQLRLSPDAKPYMYVLIGISLQAAYRDAEQSLYLSLALLALAGLLAMASAWFIGEKGIAQRLRNLASTADQLGAGDLSVRTGIIPKGGEIGRLAAAFDRMADALAQDIDARTCAEAALSQTVEQLETIFSSTHYSIVFLDSEFNFLRVNQAYADACGLPVEFYTGKNHFDIYPHQENEAIFKRVVETGEPYTVFAKPFEFPDQPERGVTYWDWTLHPVKDATGRVEALIFTLVDVTSGAKAQMELRKHRDELEIQVRQRTDELLDANDFLEMEIAERVRMSAELLLAKEQAESANKFKSDFLARMSHEIRTPLNPIIGLTELALQTEPLGERREHLEIVHNAATHLLLVINDILDISKIEAGKLELHPADFDLVRSLEASVNTMGVQAAAKDLVLDLEVAPDVPRYLKGDVGLLRQILFNLIGNAIKFTEHGGIHVAVRRAPAFEAAANDALPLVFSIKDTGMGIPEEKLETIFDSFAQADTSITRNYGGTGLGLAICRELAKLMGGDICVESHPGLGSEFTFTVVFAAGDPGRIACEYDEPQTASCLLPVRPLNILLVEDNPFNVKVALAFLSRRGHKSLTAENGVQALELLALESFDLVLMDLEMPGMNGIEATHRIRAGEAGAHNAAIPIIAMTAHALSGYRDSCLEAGMNDYVTKPVAFKLLEGAIARVMATQPAHSAIRRRLPPARPPMLDTAGALLRMDGDRELLAEIHHSFLNDFPRELAKMHEALAANDASRVALIVHSLKNLAGLAGAMACGEVTEDMQTAALASNLAVIAARLPELEATYAAARDLLLATS